MYGISYKTVTVHQLQLSLPTQNLDRECLCMVIVYLISRYDRRYKEGLTHYRGGALLWKIPWVSPTFALTPWALFSCQYTSMPTVSQLNKEQSLSSSLQVILKLS